MLCEGSESESNILLINFCDQVFIASNSLFHYCIFFQVPSLEHNNEIKGESLDLLKYIDSNFEGPSLTPDVRF